MTTHIHRSTPLLDIEAVIRFTSRVLEQELAEAEATEAQVRQLFASGTQIITYEEADDDAWEITDYVTDEVLASANDYDDAERLAEVLNVINADHVGDVSIELPDYEDLGLTEDEATELQAFVWEARSHSLLAKMAGWSLEEVERAKEDTRDTARRVAGIS